MNKQRQKHLLLTMGLVVCLVTSSAYSILFSPKARATTPSVIINEMMYHPPTDDEDEEFLELYNTTSTTIDLSGWCFTRGITLCFASGTSIVSHGYVTISPNSAKFTALYGTTPTAVYTGHLDNSGERITLKDASSITINDLTYSDHGAWPTTSDGAGPSLELKSPDSDNTVGSSWAASLDAPTPGAPNSVFLAGFPDVTAVSSVTDVTPNTSPTVTAHVTAGTTVNLVYRLNFDSEQTIQMFDDGAHNDGGAGDLTYGATIPAQAAGQLVRYKVSATNTSGTTTKPGVSDSISYYGYAVADSAVTAPAPVLQWFMPPDDYTDMDTNHVLDGLTFKCVLAYGNTVIDNTDVHVKGNYSLSWPKHSFQFEFPKGYTLTIPGYADHAVTQFDINSTYPDPSGALTTSNWWIMQQAGMPMTQVFAVRTQLNSAFQGLYDFVQPYDKEWRQLHGFDTGAFYKQFGDKKTRLNEDNSDITSWYNDVSAVRSPQRRTHILDEDNIPGIINFMATETVMQSHDWSNEGNSYEYRDTTGSGRWTVIMWDIDLTMETHLLVTPYDVPNYIPSSSRTLVSSVYDEPDFRAMYYRRLRTLADKIYANDQLVTQFTSNAATIQPLAQLDNLKWGNSGNQTVAEGTTNLLMTMAKTKRNLLVRFQRPEALPAAQTSHDVTFDSVSADTDSANQYIRLKNNSDEYIDMSQWTIQGVDYTMVPGTVAPPHGTVMFLRNDPAYRTAHGGGIFVGGQYAKNVGSSLQLKDTNNQTIATWNQ